MPKHRLGKLERLARKDAFKEGREAREAIIKANQAAGLWARDAEKRFKPERYSSIGYNFKANTHKQFYLPFIPATKIYGRKVGNKVVRTIQKPAIGDADLYTQKPDFNGHRDNEAEVRVGTSKPHGVKVVDKLTGEEKFLRVRGKPRYAPVGKPDSVPKDGAKGVVVGAKRQDGCK